MSYNNRLIKDMLDMLEREMKNRRAREAVCGMHGTTDWGGTKGTLQMIGKAGVVRKALGRAMELLEEVDEQLCEYGEHPMFGEYLVTVDPRAEKNCLFMRQAMEYMQGLLEELPDLVTVKALKERMDEDDDEEEVEESCDCDGHCKGCCPDADWCAVIYDDDDDDDLDEEEASDDEDDDDQTENHRDAAIWIYEPVRDKQFEVWSERLMKKWKRIYSTHTKGGRKGHPKK